LSNITHFRSTEIFIILFTAIPIIKGLFNLKELVDCHPEPVDCHPEPVKCHPELVEG